MRLGVNRRAGHDYELLPPDAASEPSEDAVSIDATIMLRDQLSQNSSAALNFFDPLAELLTGGGGQKHLAP